MGKRKQGFYIAKTSLALEDLVSSKPLPAGVDWDIKLLCSLNVKGLDTPLWVINRASRELVLEKRFLVLIWLCIPEASHPVFPNPPGRSWEMGSRVSGRTILDAWHGSLGGSQSLRADV